MQMTHNETPAAGAELQPCACSWLLQTDSDKNKTDVRAFHMLLFFVCRVL